METDKLIKNLRSLTPVEVLVLKGIISGDGDIGGRMSSSYPGAKPPVPDARKRFLEKLAEAVAQHSIPFDFIDQICLHAIDNETNPA